MSAVADVLVVLACAAAAAAAAAAATLAAVGSDVIRTPNPDCPACRASKAHSESEWERFHPKRGTGIDERTAPNK